MNTYISALAALSLLSQLPTYGERPNIVFIIADDISQEDLGCYGHPTIQSPHIDALAAAGMRFDNAYVTASSCSPSRCSIITGRYPHNTGAPELHQLLPDDQVTFTKLLRDAGYYTILSGKNHMIGRNSQAFEKRSNGRGPGRQEDWVELLQNRPKDKPFFAWFASVDAHRPWNFDDNAPTYEHDQVVVPPYIIDNEVTRTDFTGYYHEVSRYDYYIGEVVAELKSQGVLDNTLILVTADNGRPFPRCKTRLYDSGLKTPWIVHFPKLISQPATSDSLISSIDFSATCLELAGVEIPPSVQGVSFLPVLKDPKAKSRELIFGERNWHMYRGHERMVRFGDLVYIKNNTPNDSNLSYESGTNYPSGTEMWKAQAAGQLSAMQEQMFETQVEELFDLTKDPMQTNNLANNPEYAKALEQGRKLLGQWTKQTGDSVPDQLTPDKHAPPKIVDGEVIYPVRKGKILRGTLPGSENKATKINHPGPIWLKP
ncbi:sulfatase family protein [Persicirhabdus sediminis]|uniref:Sulfatase n=1 Tax=Persicirhabdus sediminis TaxID=454144 RepID=A0A8J7SN26_9BACT|nr:sulfatase [Persicirhabdus sediminis]MBK1792445.1 sulfatase [Persicirhabdus sediminis]